MIELPPNPKGLGCRAFKEMKNGCVFWFTGLSGVGKSTIGRGFVKRLKKNHEDVIYLDGDEMRVVLEADEKYSYEERKKIAFIYCRLCKLLADQGYDVVITTISMFHECQKWNRENQYCYYEIYLVTSFEVLMKRRASLFSSRSRNIVGIDIPAEEPKEPDVVLDNSGDRSPEEMVDEVYQQLFKRFS